MLKVVIRTNSYSTDLKVNAPLDTVKHFDIVGNVTIEHVAKASYDEFGRVGGICAIEDGRIEVQDGGEMTSIVVKAEDIENVVLDTVGSGTVGIVFVKDEPTKTTLETDNNKGVNEWIYEFFDENGEKIDPTAINPETGKTLVEEKLEEIATTSRCYIKENNVYYEKIEDAFAAVQADQAKESTDQTKKGLKTIILTRDFTNEYRVEYDGAVVLTINSESDIVFDLNGHIFNAVYKPKSKANSTTLIGNNGKLTILDSTNSSGKLSLTDELPDRQLVPSSGEYTINNSGTLIVKSGIIENLTDSGAAYAINCNSGSVNTITGGSILSNIQYAIRLCMPSSLIKLDINNAFVTGLWFHDQSGSSPIDVKIDNSTFETIHLGYNWVATASHFEMSNSTVTKGFMDELEYGDSTTNVLDLKNNNITGYYMLYPAKVITSGTFKIVLGSEVAIGWIQVKDADGSREEDWEAQGVRIDKASASGTWYQGYCTDRGLKLNLESCLDDDYKLQNNGNGTYTVVKK